MLFTFLTCPCGCFSILMQTEKTPSLFSFLTSDWVPQKYPPAALLDASLLYFTTQQHSCSSSGLVLSQHISVKVPFSLTGSPEVQTNLSGRMGLCCTNTRLLFKLASIMHNT